MLEKITSKKNVIKYTNRNKFVVEWILVRRWIESGITCFPCTLLYMFFVLWFIYISLKTWDVNVMGGNFFKYISWIHPHPLLMCVSMRWYSGGTDSLTVVSTCYYATTGTTTALRFKPGANEGDGGSGGK